MDQGECRRSTEINFRIFIVLIYINDLANVLQSNPKTLVDDTSLFSTVQDITRKTVRLSMIFEKSLNGKYNGKWNLILVLANKFMGYYLAEKKAPSHICHFILMITQFTKLNSKSIYNRLQN